MNELFKNPKRSIELPPGCKDLIDVEAIRNWKPSTASKAPTFTTDKLAYIEGYLSRVLQLTKSPSVVAISSSLNRGSILTLPDASVTQSVVFASWNGMAQRQAISDVFKEAGCTPITGKAGRWKETTSLKYALPTDASMAANLIGAVFRAGYGLGDLAFITVACHEE